MDKKLKYIIKTANDLAEEYSGLWEGDTNDFVTASAGSLDEAKDEWLTTNDVDTFADATRQGEVSTEHNWIQCEKSQGTNLFIIDSSKKVKDFS